MNVRRLYTTAALLCLCGAAPAEDVEPRRWTPLPIDLTVVGIGTIRGEGDIAFDPLLEIEDATVETTTTFVSILRTFDLFGQTARIDVRLPHEHSRWKGLLAGEPRTADRRGPGDPRVRLSVNFFGSPALRAKAFRAYRASRPVNTVVGAALAVVLPLGEYQKDKLLNLGQNRYVIRPQLGVVHSRGPWSAELTGSVSLYTDNRDFLVSHKREQDALFALQAHAIYAPLGGLWVSLSAAYDWGGESTVDGIAKGDHREDFLYGLATGIALGPQSSLQLAYVANRTQRDIGADTDYLALGCSIRF
jgi:hypothetical protein